MKYMMKCSCGDVMDIQANSKEEAIGKFKGIMTAETIAKHFQEKHQGEKVPTQEQVHMMIAQQVKPAN